MKVKKQKPEKNGKVIEIGEVGGHAHKLIKISVPTRKIDGLPDIDFKGWGDYGYAVIHPEHRNIFLAEGFTIAVQKEINIITRKLMNVLD